MTSRQDISYYFVTLGCAKNEVDSDKMSALLSAAGYREASSIGSADVVLINTCSFLVSASKESIETTLEIAQDITDNNLNIPIVMCGCLPSRYKGDLEGELHEVSAFVSVDDEDKIVSVIDKLFNISSVDVSVSNPRSCCLTSAYVKISDGCDRYCSFCAIPYIRGRYKSRTLEEIKSEVEYLLKGGCREIVLIGQDTGVWGSDFDKPLSLAKLLTELDPLVSAYYGWIRVLYLQPDGMTDELIDAFASLNSLLPYIDIPIQHSSGKILKVMNRSGDENEFSALFKKIRDKIPNMVLRTTAMAGFPGESAEDFNSLVNFLKEECFDYLSVFSYSREEGTSSFDFDNQVPEDVKLERTQILMDIADEFGFDNTASHVGEVVDVILDGIDDDEDEPEFIGHAWFQAPDSDGAVHIPTSDLSDSSVGDIVKVQLEDALCYELFGRSY